MASIFTCRDHTWHGVGSTTEEEHKKNQTQRVTYPNVSVLFTEPLKEESELQEETCPLTERCGIGTDNMLFTLALL